MTDVTRILSQMSAGDPHAASELLPLVYDELRQLAAARLAREKPGQTLQATALVHEAYLRLGGGGRGQPRNRRRHRPALSAPPRGEAGPPPLAETPRRKKRVRHGGAFHRVELAEDLLAAPGP